MYFFAGFVLLLILTARFSGKLLIAVSEFLTVDEQPVHCDAVVVLNTGMAYYPRLMEAADLYKKGFVKKVILNGNRKTRAYRELEKRGLKPCCPWYEEFNRVLELYGVPREGIVNISAEDVYDTVSEARVVGNELLDRGISKIIVTTSISHTGRADYIWKKLWANRLEIVTVAAHHDPFSMEDWWLHGRKIKIVLYEYGSWVFLLWNSVMSGS